MRALQLRRWRGEAFNWPGDPSSVLLFWTPDHAVFESTVRLQHGWTSLNRIRLWIPAPVDPPVPLLTLNTARGRIHWRRWAQMTKAWREQARLEAEAAPVALELAPGARVAIEALPVQATGRLADPGGHVPTLKACVDGLRDAGWLVDDSGEHVASVTMYPPQRSSNGLSWMIVDLLAVPEGF